MILRQTLDSIFLKNVDLSNLTLSVAVINFVAKYNLNSNTKKFSFDINTKYKINHCHRNSKFKKDHIHC